MQLEHFSTNTKGNIGFRDYMIFISLRKNIISGFTTRDTFKYYFYNNNFYNRE